MQSVSLEDYVVKTAIVIPVHATAADQETEDPPLPLQESKLFFRTRIK